MKVTRVVVTVVGLLAMLIGFLWMGQGTGLVPWPETSFMIDQRPWAYAGIALAFAGLIVMFLSRRIGGRR